MPEAVSLDGLIGRTNWDDMQWDAFRPGIRVHWLYRTGAGGAEAALLRYDPGATVPLHEHLGWEHILVLRGSQSDGTTRYKEGALLISPPGSRHAIASPEGCVVLAIWQHPVRIV
ncbi:MAG TPA: cupin domain-containing protein [Stellaceae bacterium]|nr:cupin domain-containing protein [Stellaceae bacterium]